MRIWIIALAVLLTTELLAQITPEALRTVNSPYDEQNPVLSPDGNTLFFTIGNHPANVGGQRDPGDIWFARREGTGWSSPVHGGTLLNDRGYNAVIGISPDGEQLFLNGHYGSGGSPARTQGISVSRNRGGGWSQPENISIPYFLNKSGILHGALSADNSVFVFSAESYGTHGVEDIYVSLRRNGQWTEPRNLGPVINTQFQELSPSLSDDKTTLYFSSNGRKGNGSFDVFSSTRLDDTWTNWSTPENLGNAVNTEGRELFYRPYATRGIALFTTTKSSDGYGDIRVYADPEAVPLADSVLADEELPSDNSVASPVLDLGNTQASAQPLIANDSPPESAGVTLRGVITNAKTGEAIEARIAFEGPGMEPQRTVATASGFRVALPAAEYTVRIEANGYVSAMEKLDIDAPGMRELEMNFKLQPVEVGTTVNLKNVLFAQAKTDILPESYPELDLVVAFMKDNPSVRIELMGHTDGRGVPADNVRLSQRRVDKVKEYLVSRGIAPNRISGKGYGGARPIASNDTEESRRMNRRVEFVIKKY